MEDNKIKKITDLLNFSDKELKVFLKKVMVDQTEIFDWKDFDDRINHFIGVESRKYTFLNMVMNTSVRKITNGKTDSKWNLIDRDDLIPSIRNKVLEYTKKLGCFIYEDNLIVRSRIYKGEMYNEYYTDIYYKGEEIKEKLEYILSQMRVVIDDHNEKSKVITDFFGEEVLKEPADIFSINNMEKKQKVENANIIDNFFGEEESKEISDISSINKIEKEQEVENTNIIEENKVNESNNIIVNSSEDDLI